MYVTPESFARQLSWLETHFRVLPLHELVARFEQARALPHGACAITFDDGWLDNYAHALPELARRGLPATVFVVTDRVGTEGGFWPDEVCLRMAPFSEPDRRRLAAKLGATSSGDAVERLPRRTALRPGVLPLELKMKILAAALGDELLDGRAERRRVAIRNT